MPLIGEDCVWVFPFMCPFAVLGSGVEFCELDHSSAPVQAQFTLRSRILWPMKILIGNPRCGDGLANFMPVNCSTAFLSLHKNDGSPNFVFSIIFPANQS